MGAIPDEPGLRPPGAPLLGSLLVERGLLTEEQLAAGLEEQKRSDEPLGKVLIALGFVDAGIVAQALATQHGGLLKSEYGFATGFATGQATAPVLEPPVSTASPDAAPIASELRLVPTPDAPSTESSAAPEVPAPAEQSPEPEAPLASVSPESMEDRAVDDEPEVALRRPETADTEPEPDPTPDPGVAAAESPVEEVATSPDQASDVGQPATTTSEETDPTDEDEELPEPPAAIEDAQEATLRPPDTIEAEAEPEPTPSPEEPAAEPPAAAEVTASSDPAPEVEPPEPAEDGEPTEAEPVAWLPIELVSDVEPLESPPVEAVFDVEQPTTFVYEPEAATQDPGEAIETVPEPAPSWSLDTAVDPDATRLDLESAARITHLEAELVSAQGQQARLRSRVVELEAELTETRLAAETAANDYRTARVDAENATARIAKLEHELASACDADQALLAENDRLRAAIAEESAAGRHLRERLVRQRLADVERRLDEMSAQLAALQEARG